MVTITIEGDEDGVVALLEGHVLAFFNQSPISESPAEFVRVVVSGVTGRVDVDAGVRIASIQNADVLYRQELYIADETPYNALWRSLRELLAPRIYDALKKSFNQKNAAYSKKKYKEFKSVEQKSMF